MYLLIIKTHLIKINKPLNWTERRDAEDESCGESQHEDSSWFLSVGSSEEHLRGFPFVFFLFFLLTDTQSLVWTWPLVLSVISSGSPPFFLSSCDYIPRSAASIRPESSSQRSVSAEPCLSLLPVAFLSVASWQNEVLIRQLDQANAHNDKIAQHLQCLMCSDAVSGSKLSLYCLTKVQFSACSCPVWMSVICGGCHALALPVQNQCCQFASMSINWSACRAKWAHVCFLLRSRLRPSLFSHLLLCFVCFSRPVWIVWLQQAVWVCVYLHLDANLCVCVVLFSLFESGGDIFLCFFFFFWRAGRLRVNRRDQCTWDVCVCHGRGGGLRRSCGEIALTAVLLLFNYQLQQPPIPSRVGGWRRMRRW